MANKRTYINADQELIIQGKLTIEGEVEQRQYVNTKVFDQTEFQGDVLVVNSDGFDIDGNPANAAIKLRSGNSNVELRFSESTGSLEITGGDLQIDAITLDTLTATTITDSVLSINSGAITNATSITSTSFVGNLTGDVTGTVSSIANHTTTDLTEGTNLYYTDARFDSRLATKSTDDVSEGSNLYYTQGRFDSAFSAKSTTHLSEGNNLYYTQGRFDSAFSAKTTTDLTEGTKLYFTTDRADDRVNLQTGSNLDLSQKSTTELSEGTNLYYTDTRVDARIALQSGSNLDLSGKTTDDLTEGASNQYYTDSRARAAISHVDAGGDGSLSYNSTTGVITYTGPSASEVRAHFSGDDGIDLTGGGIAVDSTVVRTSSAQTIADTKTFSGTLDVTGTITVPTQAQSDNSTKAASTAYVRTAVSDLIDNAPAALDTLNELAAALNDDATIGGIVSNNTTRIGTLESRNLTAGAGLTGGGDLSADRTFNVVAGTGITVNADSVQTDDAYIKGLLSSSGDLSYNSTTGQFSVTTYKSTDFDTDFSGKTTTGLTEGTNLYYTQARFDSAFGNKTTTDLTEGSNLYYTQARFDSAFSAKDTDDLVEGSVNRYYSTALVNAHLDGADGIDYVNGSIAVDSTVVRTTGDQSIAGNISFTGELIMPQNGILPANDGSIFHDNQDVFAVINGSSVKLTPQSDVGEIEDAGLGEIDIYAGFRTVALGNANVKYHGIKSISSDAYINLVEAANVITVSADTTQFTTLIRGALSASDNGGDGSFGYNSTTGVFTYTGPSATEVRNHFSAGTGINISNGVISATGDNYGSWTVQTDSGAGSAEPISSGETLQILGGTNITVENTGNAITIRNDNVADINSVAAGSGLTGGGNAGDITLNVGAGTGITVNADDIAVNMGVFSTSDLNEGSNKYFTVARARDAISAGGDLSYSNVTGVVSFTERTDNQVRSLISVTDSGGDGSLSYNNTTGVITYTGPSATEVRAHISAGGDLSYNSTTGVVSFTERTDAEVRGLISASGDISYNSTTGVISFTNDAGDIESVTAGTGLTGGGSSGDVTLNVDMTAFDTDDLAEGTSNLYFTDARARSALSGGTGISYNSTTGAISLTDTGYVTGVTAGGYLTGGGTEGTVSLAVDASTVNTASKVVARDASGNFSAGTITADLTGDVTGNLTGTASFATQAYVTEDNTNVSAQRLVFHGGDGSGNKSLRHDDDLTYTPSTNTLSAGIFSGTATSARYADLAEKYATDADYEAGTVVVFGGDAEVTVTTQSNDFRVAGVISTDPAYMMNSEADGQYVALRGRVPCKVVGPVKKGDILITSHIPGVAMASDQPHFVSASCIVGKAISGNDTDGINVIEILV